MSNKVEYTRAGYPKRESEVIDILVHNSNTDTLHVALTSGEVYSYFGVTGATYNEFREAESAGTYYNERFKRFFGPGRHIGPYKDIFWEFVPVTTPKGLTYSEDAARFTLGREPKAVPSGRKHVVTFSIDGLDEERIFTLEAKDVDSAVAELYNRAVDLGIDAKPKSVTVYLD